MKKCFLGVSTVGPDSRARVCDIAVVDESGEPLIHTTLNPRVRIESEGTRRHGLTNLICSKAPTMAQIEIRMMNAVHGRQVITWNKPAVIYHLAGFVISSMASMECCQLRYSEYCGDFEDGAEVPTIQSMSKAMEDLSMTWDAGNQHRALPRAQITRSIWEYLEDADAVLNWKPKPLIF